jgi:hypothetical protein
MVILVYYLLVVWMAGGFVRFRRLAGLGALSLAIAFFVAGMDLTRPRTSFGAREAVTVTETTAGAFSME